MYSRSFGKAFALIFLILSIGPISHAQSVSHTLYGDIRVDESKAEGSQAISFDLILYNESRIIVSRQSVSSVGRYRFNNLRTGFYDLVVEVENQEVACVRIDLSSPLIDELRQDLSFEWKRISETGIRKPTIISAADRYERNSANAALFTKAGAAIDRRRYSEGLALLQKILNSDSKDFQAWTELGNIYLLERKNSDAENAYLQAIDLHPHYSLALLNLARAEVAQGKYDIALEVLKEVIKVRPDSPDANYLLGESYLQLKKGSLAVDYFNRAIQLDSRRMSKAHLRLALLYDAAGMKEKAADEYQQFLKLEPHFRDRKKLEKYISTVRKD